MRRVSSPQHHSGDSDRAGAVPYIPLSSDDGSAGEQESIGSLVSDAARQVSTLVRAEVELIKSEAVGEAKKAAKGSVFFVVAGVVALYSSFFFFFFLGELLAEWLPRWAAFGIVFLSMLVVAGLFGYLGLRKWKRVRKPQRSLDSLKDTADTLRHRGHPASPEVSGHPATAGASSPAGH
ncbi:phage holin family protein [Saccharomonospora saliphila]|uniref:phage holin family protein n=1 Tax=Saccharomonospora saliphila TaxID=369829 RepID=UPI00048B646B|nr:phage holin family protein [Saccharomonospora saliphila]